MKPHRMGPTAFQPVDRLVEKKAIRLPTRLAWPINSCFFILLLFHIFTSPVFGEKDWFELGLTALKMQNYDAAIEALTMAVEVLPHDFEAYNNRGVAWFGKGDYRRAIGDFTKAVKLNPDFEVGFLNRAIARFHTRFWEATINDADQALAINPSFFEALCARAAAWTKLKQYQKAIRDYTSAYGQKTAAPTSAVRRLKEGAASPLESRSANTPRPYGGRVLVLQLLNKEIREHGIFVHIQNLKASAAESEKPSSPPLIAAAKPQTATGFNEKPETVSIKKAKRTNPTPKPPAPPVQPSVAKRRPFTIHISSFRQAVRALGVTHKLMQKKDPAVVTPVMIPGRGMWYRVLVGFYETRRKAKTAAVVLKKRKFRYVQVMKRPWAIAVDTPRTDSAKKHLQISLRQFGFSTYGAKQQVSIQSDKILVGAFKSKNEAAPFVRRLQDAGFKTKVLKR